jgi:uncharacterized protein (TIGR00369 family)
MFAPSDRATQLDNVRHFIGSEIPFNRELGLTVVTLEEGLAVLEVPFRDGLVGDPVRPALHGGVASALLDTAGGAAVWTCIGEQDRCSTIDLRIDYLRPMGLETVRAEARVLRVGNKVGVTTMRLFHPSAPEETLVEGKGVYSVKRVDEQLT